MERTFLFPKMNLKAGISYTVKYFLKVAHSQLCRDMEESPCNDIMQVIIFA